MKPPAPSTPLPTELNLLKEPSQREVSKRKYTLGLIDQAVKTLFEIWHPEDIPCVFIGPLKSLFNPPSQSLVSTVAEMYNALIPLKNFVHEVLKRSRTSGSIMQTALCYVEAIRSEVPEILRNEKLGIRLYCMPKSVILPATKAEIQMDQKLSNLEVSDTSVVSNELIKTIRPTDEDVSVQNMAPELTMVMHMPTTSSLPSPLLCPRRTFLAALILASKFSQDKSYSNRAWAKLSGLPPREIGRCEHALGQTLDWRLWVGKKVPTSSLSAPHTVVRSQNESLIAFTESAVLATLGTETLETCPPRKIRFATSNKIQNPLETLPIGIRASFFCTSHSSSYTN